MPIYLPEKKKKEVEESESTVLRILELLNRPAKAAMGGIRAFTDPKETRSFAPIKRAYENFVGDKRDTGKAVAQDLGMKGIAASMVGGIGDVAADPLNLLMVGAVDDAVRGGLRAASNATIKPAAKTIASKSPQFLKNAGNEVLDTVTEGIRWSVNPFFRMPEEIARTGRLNQAAQRSAPQRVLEDVMKRGWGSGQPWKGEMTFAALSPADQAIIAKHPQYSAATADSLAKGFITEKLQKTIDQVRQQETVEAFQNFISNPGHKKFLTYAPSPKHTQIAQIKQFPTKNLPGPTTWQYVPDDLLEALLPTHRGKRTSMGKYWDKGMDMWRSGVTKWNIPFHVTNDIGNKYNIFADTGLNPVTVKRSGKLLRGQGVIENAQQLVHSPQEILKALKKFDVDHGLQQHATYFGDDLESTAQSVREAIYGRQPSTGKFGKVKDVFKGVSEFIDTKISDPIERNPRVGLVVEQLRKLTPGIKAREQELLSMGASPTDAAKFARQEALEKSVIQTKDTMFDYRELTPREQVLRQVAAPFYTYTRKNIPVQVRSLIKRPWFPAHVGKARETLENFSEDTGVRIDPSLIPDWLDEGVQLPFNYDKQPVFLRNKLPLMDLAYLDPTNPETIRQARSMLGPLPKAASEVIFNMNFNNPQRKLMDQRGFSTPVAAPEWLQALPESVGSLFMDVHRDPVDKRLRQYKIPVWASLLTRDIPLNTQARGARGMADMTGLGGDVKDPLSALAFLGLPITAQNRKYLERTRTARRMEDKKQKGMERKERGRLIKKSAIDRILEGEFD